MEKAATPHRGSISDPDGEEEGDMNLDAVDVFEDNGEVDVRGHQAWVETKMEGAR